MGRKVELRTVVAAAAGVIVGVGGTLGVTSLLQDGRPERVVVVSPSPTPIAWDEDARIACQTAAEDADALALSAARASTVRELQDLALRQEQLRNPTLIKDWCAKNYRGD